jgi:uncharacterized membrane protein
MTTDDSTQGFTWGDNIRHIRNRVIAGVFVVLPIFITFGVVRWLYDTLYHYALGPIASFLRETWFKNPDIQEAAKTVSGAVNVDDSVFGDVLLSFLSFASLFAILFVAGMFAQSRLHRFTNWILLNVPGVKTIYAAVSNVFNAVSGSQGVRDFKRVVLIEFPHPGIKAPAFVTSECTDLGSGEKILCVYVPTTPIPTSGYMLMVREQDVVPLNWDIEETLQGIVSGGITVPKNVTYHAPKPA